MEGHRAWIALNLEHLRHNVAALQALLPPGCRLMPVVKANAYGHGAVPIAQALSRLGIRSFCVATAEEGAELRRHHIPGDILILGFTPVEELSLVRRYDLIQTVVDWDYARQLNRLGAPIRVHVAVDTGMHRLGERWENLERIWAIFSMEHLQVEGMFTHHHGSGPNQAVSANLRGLSLHLTDGDVLINPAAGTNSGITGDVDAVKAVG